MMKRNTNYQKGVHRVGLDLVLRLYFFMPDCFLNCSGKVKFVSNRFLYISCQRGQKKLPSTQECVPPSYVRLWLHVLPFHCSMSLPLQTSMVLFCLSAETRFSSHWLKHFWWYLNLILWNGLLFTKPLLGFFVCLFVFILSLLTAAVYNTSMCYWTGWSKAAMLYWGE